MGASSSELCHKEGEDPVGYRVLTVHPNGPAANVTVVHNGERQLMKEERELGQALVPYFDFIISINGKRLDEDNGYFTQEIRKSEGQPVDLEIFNAKCGRLRVVQLTPRQHGGSGFLGVSVRFDTYLGCRDNALRVLEVAPESPAYLSGLTPLEDYILAADDCVFECLDDFGDYLIDKEGEQVTLFVYNSSRDSVREVSVLVSTKPWGASEQTGLGVSVGTGHLHVLPNQDTIGFPEFDGQVPIGPSAVTAPVSTPKADPAFTDIPLDTPKLSPVPPALPPPALPLGSAGKELPAWESDGSPSDESQYSDSDGGSHSPPPQAQLHFVDEHAHSHA